MRRLIVILLSALAVVPAALAAGQATGDGVLELKAAYGTIGIGRDLQPARGILWGQMDKGKLVVYDPVSSDPQTIFVSGWDRNGCSRSSTSWSVKPASWAWSRTACG